MLAGGFGKKPVDKKKKPGAPKPSQACPCFSGKPYGECCKPFHDGKKNPQPVEVMRSRYAAYAWYETLNYLLIYFVLELTFWGSIHFFESVCCHSC